MDPEFQSDTEHHRYHGATVHRQLLRALHVASGLRYQSNVEVGSARLPVFLGGLESNTASTQSAGDR
jgi:hypothetical protein